MIVASKLPAALPTDVFVNTLYFNVTTGPIDPVGYQDLVDDLHDIWKVQPWTKGQSINIRAYNMEDAKPRPIRAEKTGMSESSGAYPPSPAQVALCLSYYGDRNLPSRRGRIYLGPWTAPGSRPTSTEQGYLTAFAGALSGLGGLNVDWSVYSPKTGEHHAITNGWVDNSWDIIRSRKLGPTSRVTYTANG